MQFTTKILIPKSNFSINYNSKIVSLGSCFAENMAEKLDYYKFQNNCNSFGIIFNPFSIEKIIHKVVNQELFSDKDIFYHNERWHCFDVHSDLSNADKDELISNLNSIVIATKLQLQTASHIIITYGTSWVYRNIDADLIVANCHKITQAAFSKEILSVETIQKSIQNTLDLIHTINPKVTFIFTVSPVRHLKDGFVENQISKANLLVAIYKQLQIKNSRQSTAYFPSYEIMIDELRDYRFYADDMIHPSPVAINYIWQCFSETSISDESQLIMKEVEIIQKGLAHRTFNPNSESHQQFLSKLQDKMVKVQKRFPQIQF
jgi:hypothetical protein